MCNQNYTLQGCRDQAALRPALFQCCAWKYQLVLFSVHLACCGMAIYTLYGAIQRLGQQHAHQSGLDLAMHGAKLVDKLLVGSLCHFALFIQHCL